MGIICWLSSYMITSLTSQKQCYIENMEIIFKQIMLLKTEKLYYDMKC